MCDLPFIVIMFDNSGPTAPRAFLDEYVLGEYQNGGDNTGAVFGHKLLLGIFVYGGLVLDLVLLPVGLNCRFLPLHYVSVVAALTFHLCNHFLFVIETFPFVMISATFIFCNGKFVGAAYNEAYRRLFQSHCYARLKAARLYFVGIVTESFVPAIALFFLVFHMLYPMKCAWSALWSKDLCFTRYAVYFNFSLLVAHLS